MGGLISHIPLTTLHTFNIKVYLFTLYIIALELQSNVSLRFGIADLPLEGSNSSPDTDHINKIVLIESQAG